MPWKPYPLDKPVGTAYQYQSFDELCNLVQIGIAVQTLLFDGTQNRIVRSELQQAANVLLQQLQEWHDNLPSRCHVQAEPPPTPDVFELQ